MENYPKRTFPPVSPERLAQKLAAIQNFEYPDLFEQLSDRPRLTEMLWFLQAMSMQPGGLDKFTKDLLETLPNRIGTNRMHRALASNGKYSLEICLEIWEELPIGLREDVEPSDFWSIESLIDDEPSSGRNYLAESRRDGELEKKLKSWNRPFFLNLCREAALKRLPSFFSDLCNDEAHGFLGETCWFMDDVVGAVFEMMDLHSKRASERIAKTEVTLKVFDALDFVLAEKCMARIEGDTRFGKTESVRAWCDMRPGLARLLPVPCSNSDADLFKAIADSLGIHYGLAEGRRLKERVEFVIRHSCLMFVFDEAHFLIPQRFSKATPPMRLNWVRTQMADKKVPLALISTPQTYSQEIQKFVKVTGHNIDQFLGRNLFKIFLPKELSHEDLLAVAKVHFPDLDIDCLGLIAAKAMQSESYLMAVEAIAKRSRYIARREGHIEITLEDLDLAISEIIPPIVDSVPKRTNRDAVLARRRGESAKPVQAPCSASETLVGNHFTGRNTSVLKAGNRSDVLSAANS